MYLAKSFGVGVNGTTRTDGSQDTFVVTSADRGAAYFSLTFTINSCDAGGTASVGGYVVIGIGFSTHNGTMKASAETPLSFCPVLPPLMPS